MRLIETPEMKKLWDIIYPYLEVNSLKVECKPGTPEKIRKLVERYKSLADTQYKAACKTMMTDRF